MLALDGAFGAHDQAHLLTEEDTEAQRGDRWARCQVEPELEAWPPGPSPFFLRALTAASPSQELPSMLLVHTWPSVLFVLGCVSSSLPQIICKMNLVSTPGTQWKNKKRLESPG